MDLFKTLLVLGLAAVSPFSIAQQIVQPGNQKAPYQPPAWFVRMAKPGNQFPPPVDSFIVSSKEPTRIPPKTSGIKYPCKKGDSWHFCDM